MLHRFLALIFLIAGTCEGSMVAFSGTPIQTLSANGINVPVYPKANLMLPEAVSDQLLYLTGAGIRMKKVLFFREAVYTVTSYKDSPAVMSPRPLQDISNSQYEIIQLILLMDLRASQIRTAFEDCLIANSIDIDSPEIRALLDEIKYDMPARSVFTMVSEALPDGGGERVHIEVPWKTFFQDGATLGLDLWKIYFGIPVDAEMADLKARLLGQ